MAIRNAWAHLPISPLKRPDKLIRVFDESGAVIETHEHAGDFKEW